MIFRTGRHLGRTIYVQLDDEPDRTRDVEVGMVDTPALGSLVCTALNAYAQSGDLPHRQVETIIRDVLAWRRIRP